MTYIHIAIQELGFDFVDLSLKILVLARALLTKAMVTRFEQKILRVFLSKSQFLNRNVYREKIQ